MADEPTTETTETQPAEVTEDDLRNLIGEVVEEKLSTISEGIGGIVDSVVTRLKEEGTSGTSEDSLLEKIGGMIDEKLKGFSGGSNGETKKPREPKLKIFSS